jgi:hypothetical protein
MEIVKQVPAKARKPGRPRAIPEEIEPIVVELYNRGYGYRPIARILRTTNNPPSSRIQRGYIPSQVIQPQTCW